MMSVMLQTEQKTHSFDQIRLMLEGEGVQPSQLAHPVTFSSLGSYRLLVMPKDTLMTDLL